MLTVCMLVAAVWLGFVAIDDIREIRRLRARIFELETIMAMARKDAEHLGEETTLVSG